MSEREQGLRRFKGLEKATRRIRTGDLLPDYE
jgi:hypothetical protein